MDFILNYKTPPPLYTQLIMDSFVCDCYDGCCCQNKYYNDEFINEKRTTNNKKT